MYTFEAFWCKRIATENIMFTELFQYISIHYFNKQKVGVIHYDLVHVQCTDVEENVFHF